MTYHKPRAFVLESCSIDVSQAKDFGEITYIIANGERRVSIWDPNFTLQIVERLSALKYDPDRDHFVVVGHMVPLALVISALVQAVGPFKALLYSSTERQYVSRKLGDITDDKRRHPNLYENPGPARGAVPAPETTS